MKQPFVQFRFVRAGKLALEARVRAMTGTARHGQWVWTVCAKKDRRQVIAKSRRPYLRKYGAVRGARRAFPKAEIVVVAGGPMGTQE
jgi:hypothetical protein